MSLFYRKNPHTRRKWRLTMAARTVPDLPPPPPATTFTYFPAVTLDAPLLQLEAVQPMHIPDGCRFPYTVVKSFLEYLATNQCFEVMDFDDAAVLDRPIRVTRDVGTDDYPLEGTTSLRQLMRIQGTTGVPDQHLYLYNRGALVLDERNQPPALDEALNGLNHPAIVVHAAPPADLDDDAAQEEVEHAHLVQDALQDISAYQHLTLEPLHIYATPPEADIKTLDQAIQYLNGMRITHFTPAALERLVVEFKRQGLVNVHGPKAIYATAVYLGILYTSHGTGYLPLISSWYNPIFFEFWKQGTNALEHCPSASLVVIGMVKLYRHQKRYLQRSKANFGVGTSALYKWWSKAVLQVFKLAQVAIIPQHWESKHKVKWFGELRFMQVFRSVFDPRTISDEVLEARAQMVYQRSMSSSQMVQFLMKK